MNNVFLVFEHYCDGDGNFQEDLCGVFKSREGAEKCRQQAIDNIVPSGMAKYSPEYVIEEKPLEEWNL